MSATGTSATDPQVNDAGERRQLGRYTDLRLLGKGGMGAVYRARDPALSRDVAIKVMSDRSAEFSARFTREAQALARLSHARIVQVYDCGEAEDGSPYFVMELLAGRSLERVLEERGRLPWQEVVRVMIQAAEGLAAAHAVGIVHRDIKPANLVLDGGGQLKLVDFGIARFAQLKEGESALTRPQSLLGTPLYMAPELLSGNVADGRVDIYALGLTGYHLLTGQPPFSATSALALVMKQLSEPLPDMTRDAPQAPPALVALIRRMAEKDPAARIQTCEDVALALNALLRDGERQAQSPAARPPRPLWLVGVVAGLCGVAVMALVLMRAPKGTRPTPVDPRTIKSDAGKGDPPAEPPPVKDPKSAGGAGAPEQPPGETARAALHRGKGPLRLAVLRFKNLGGERDLEFLTEGISETLVTALGAERRLRLLERNQVEQALQEIDFGQTRYVDKRTAAALGRIAGAEVAVQGGYQRTPGEAGQLRVTARLVHIETGEILDSLVVTKPAKAVFDIQDAVASELLRHVRPLLRGG